MSSARQAVTRSLSFTGFGALPELTQRHQVVEPTGMMCGISCRWRMKPVAGTVGASWVCMLGLCRLQTTVGGYGMWRAVWMQYDMLAPACDTRWHALSQMPSAVS